MAPISNTAQIAGYAYILPSDDPADANAGNQTTDGQMQHGDGAEGGHIIMVNGTLVRLLLKPPFRDSQLNELLYVIIVIVFYATALMTLIITQIKRQRREGMDVEYYDEYLQRNSEVRKTCKTATSLVLKTGPPSSSTLATNATTVSTSVSGGGDGRGSSSTSASVPAAAATALLLEPPSRVRDISPGRLSPRLGFGRGGGEGEFVCYTPSPSPRELSPMLESIPDIGT